MSIGENVKALRQRKGLTQSQLASASGMQLTQVSRIENDDTDPKASTLNKIIKALNTSKNKLFSIRVCIVYVIRKKRIFL